MSVPVRTQPTFSAGKPTMVLDGPYLPGSPGLPNYDVSADGQRFLMVQPGDDEAGPAVIRVVVNWFGDLRRRFSVAR